MRRVDVKAVVRALGIEVIEERKYRLVARCPAHADGKVPNWDIAFEGANRGKHHCHACQFGGVVVDLVAHVLFKGEDDPKSSAREWLENFTGEVPAEPAPAHVALVLRSRTAARFALPMGVTFAPIEDWVTPARRYIEEVRRIPAEQVARWGIGYAALGRLRGRIVVVVRDRHGVPQNYMGRTFTESDRRYLFPRSSENPNMDALFGAQHWPDRIADRAVVYVAEGAFKALALERATSGNIAALAGSQLRPSHARQLATFKRVVYVKDSGSAGDKAAEAVRTELSRHARVEVVSLREKEDADSIPLEELRSCLNV